MSMTSWNDIRGRKPRPADRLPKPVRKKQLLDFIESYWTQNGAAPSLEEMGAGIEPPLSRSVVSRYLQEMEAAGQIVRGVSVSRTYRPKGYVENSSGS